MHRLVRYKTRTFSGNGYSCKLIAGVLLATTFTLSTACAKAESPLQVPNSAEIIVLRSGDVKSGSGLVRTPAGMYDGNWKDAAMTTGRLKTVTGNVVTLSHSPAEITYQNGDKYKGNVDRATLLPHGKGSFTSPHKVPSLGLVEKYTGMFQEGKYHGEGELQICVNGDEPAGDIDHSTPLLWPFPHLQHYRGMFKAGKYHGQGRLAIVNSPDGNWLYTGTFVEGAGKPESWPDDALRYERWEGGRCVEVI